jgi:hypothetical protein
MFSNWLPRLDLKLLALSGGTRATAGQIISGAISAAFVGFANALLAGCYNIFSRISERRARTSGGIDESPLEQLGDNHE